MQYLILWGTSGQFCQDHILIGGGESINRLSNKEKPWNGKLIRRLLLTVTIADPEWFIPKDKPITYTWAFFKLYN